MRYGVLLFGRHIGKGDGFAIGDEEWVVTKTLAARLLGGYSAIYYALYLLLYTAADKLYHGAEACSADLLALQFVEQFAVVGGKVVAIGGVACRVYPWCSIESLYLEASIVGKAV